MRRRVLLPLIVASLLVPAVAAAQDAPEPITWIAFSKTKPGKGQEAVQNILKWDKGIYDKLLADGDALSWGIGIPINHWPGDNWDLALWVTMPDWSKVGVLQKGFEDAFRSRSPEQQK